MASTYHCLYAHIVFATDGRAPTIAPEWRQDLHAYRAGTLIGLEAKPIIVNGVADHIHILTAFKPSQALSDLVRDVKKASSIWASERHKNFAWQVGYAAFTVSISDVPRVTEYIAHQEEHHKTISSIDELRALLIEWGIEFKEIYFE